MSVTFHTARKMALSLGNVDEETCYGAARFRVNGVLNLSQKCRIFRMIRRAILGMCVLVFLPISAAWACTCTQAAPGKCGGLQKDDVVFLGTVTDIQRVLPANTDAAPANSDAGAIATNTGVAPASTPFPVTRYRFRIDEKFAGVDAAEIEVFSGGEDADCGYQFQKGEQYIVFTQQETEGRLFATICNGTRPVGEGQALLPQLRAMRGGQRVASVFGVLRRSDPPFLAPAGDPDDPLPRVGLKLRSHYDRFQTTTDADGVYSFYDVHAGEYAFTANLPARMELTQKTLVGGLPPFKIPNGACYEFNVNALPTGHIQGTVYGPNGKPLKIASLELYRAGSYEDARPGLWSFQGAKGIFDFDHVGAGEYVIVYNRRNLENPNSPFPRAFYPGVADPGEEETITLKDGQELLKVNLKLAEGYPTRKLRVHLKWDGPRPPGTVTIQARADRGDNPAAEKTADGTYEFTLLDSANYTITAFEELLPGHAPTRRAKARRGAGRTQLDCTVPPRVDASSVDVPGADATAKEITILFPSITCTNP
jgi:hypothetical protein